MWPYRVYFSVPVISYIDTCMRVLPLRFYQNLTYKPVSSVLILLDSVSTIAMLNIEVLLARALLAFAVVSLRNKSMVVLLMCK